jgi:dienelactone hydrolase
VDASRIALLGLSRGAEAALLLASTFPDVSTVVAFAPSAYLWMGQRPPDYQLIPSWTINGKALPFVPTKEARAYRADDNEAERHLRYLATHPDSTRVATIPVERIRGPVLLFSGGRDPIWPSTFMVERIGARLTEHRFSYAVRSFSYDSAGHAFARPGYISTVPGGFSGGAPWANAYAQRDSWRRTLDHLTEWARTTR